MSTRNIKPYKVKFMIQVYCGGVYRFVETHLTIPAESEEAARKKILSTDCTVVSTNKVEAIDLSKL